MSLIRTILSNTFFPWFAQNSANWIKEQITVSDDGTGWWRNLELFSCEFQHSCERGLLRHTETAQVTPLTTMNRPDVWSSSRPASKWSETLVLLDEGQAGVTQHLIIGWAGMPIDDWLNWICRNEKKRTNIHFVWKLWIGGQGHLEWNLSTWPEINYHRGPSVSPICSDLINKQKKGEINHVAQDPLTHETSRAKEGLCSREANPSSTQRSQRIFSTPRFFTIPIRKNRNIFQLPTAKNPLQSLILPSALPISSQSTIKQHIQTTNKQMIHQISRSVNRNHRSEQEKQEIPKPTCWNAIDVLELPHEAGCDEERAIRRGEEIRRGRCSSRRAEQQPSALWLTDSVHCQEQTLRNTWRPAGTAPTRNRVPPSYAVLP